MHTSLDCCNAHLEMFRKQDSNYQIADNAAQDLQQVEAAEQCLEVQIAVAKPCSRQDISGAAAMHANMRLWKVT